MTDLKNNIIKFPISNKRIDVLKEIKKEDIEDKILELKLTHIGEALILILPNLFNNIDTVASNYADLENFNDVKDINLIAESIKSLLYKYYNIKHPFQELSEKVFSVSDDNEIGLNSNVEICFEELYPMFFEKDE